MAIHSYVVNKNPQDTGEHEVHDEDTCPVLPAQENRIFLGKFANCRGAMVAAGTIYHKVDGCGFCAPLCHSG